VFSLSLSLLSRLWQHVSAALRKNDQETATTEKCKIEDAQREAVRRREEEKVRSQPSLLFIYFFIYFSFGTREGHPSPSWLCRGISD
jgi:hypothetical protein